MSSASGLTDQLQGWGTAIAAVAAVAALIAGIVAYRAQSHQLRLQQQQINDQAEVLELQATELRAAIADRQRADLERRRAQAVQVYIVEEVQDFRAERGRPGRRLVATVHNASQLPVHDPKIVWHEPEGEFSGILPPYLAPGKTVEHTYRSVDGGPDDAPPAVFATAHFRDAAGVHWEISAHGSPRPLNTGDSPDGER